MFERLDDERDHRALIFAAYDVLSNVVAGPTVSTGARPWPYGLPQSAEASALAAGIRDEIRVITGEDFNRLTGEQVRVVTVGLSQAVTRGVSKGSAEAEPRLAALRSKFGLSGHAEATTTAPGPPRTVDLSQTVGQSARWRETLNLAKRVGASESSVLLLGEPGSGKQVVARAIHQASSRATGPFATFDCNIVPASLQERELFGHLKGAFTGATTTKLGKLEEANGGTLFFDEIVEMDRFVQAKLLHVLETRGFQRLGDERALPVNARIIASTTKNPDRAIADGELREDLYFRLGVVVIKIPPLRERRDDILPLAELFLSKAIGAARVPKGISQAAQALLVQYDWPGNVRELRNVIERAVVLSEPDVIEPAHLPRNVASSGARTADDVASAIESTVQRVERTMIETALRKAEFDKRKAAEALGLSAAQLAERMRLYGIH